MASHPNTRRKILAALFNSGGGPISNAHIHRETHLAEATIKQCLNEFATAGMVEDKRFGKGLTAAWGYALGAVVGSQALRVVAADVQSNGTLATREQKLGPVQAWRWPALAAEIVRVIALVDGEAHKNEVGPLRGITVALPVPLRADDPLGSEPAWTVPPQMSDWSDQVEGRPLGIALRRELDRLGYNGSVPLRLANDANCEAYGEYHLGEESNRTARSLLAIKVSGGIGSGLVLDGRLRLGANGSAGEIGHLTLPAGLPPSVSRTSVCRCGAPSLARHLEQHASADAIVNQLGLAADGRRSADVIADHLGRHDDVQRQLDNAAGCIGAVVREISTLLDLDRVVLRGPLARIQPERFAQRVQDGMDRDRVLFNPPTIVTGSGQQFLAARGAARLAFEDLHKGWLERPPESADVLLGTG